MPTLTASTLITKAAYLLNDNDNTRWTLPEMYGWLTDGQREAVVIRPTLFCKVVARTLVAGPRQSLADITDYNLLVVIKRNLAADGVTGGRVIGMTSEALLDALDPDWHTSPSAMVITNFTFDPATRTVYQVYPPAIAGAKVELTYSAIPPAVVDGTDVISLPDETGTALIDYLCYRALSKDAEFGDNSAKAAAHYKLFTDAIPKV
jgi:hypothetical protein